MWVLNAISMLRARVVLQEVSTGTDIALLKLLIGRVNGNQGLLRRTAARQELR